jgi:hypothetical protein
MRWPRWSRRRRTLIEPAAVIDLDELREAERDPYFKEFLAEAEAVGERIARQGKLVISLARRARLLSALSRPPGAFGSNTLTRRKQGARLVPTSMALQHRASGAAVDSDTLAIGDEAVASGVLPGAAAARPKQASARVLRECSLSLPRQR